MASSRQTLLLSLALLLACSPAPDCPPVGSAVASAPASAALSAAPTGAAPKLTFKKLGREIKSLDLKQIVAAIPPVTVKQQDPYYNREKSYKAVPLARVIEIGFADEKGLPSQEFVLRALDGYTVPLRGSKVFEPGAFVAFEDLEQPGWEPIGQQRANPGPFYLVWANKEQTNLETHPRPYQLSVIEIADFEALFPWTVPVGAPADSLARRGFAIFREQCIHCHAINRQGGRVGPELNVPQSVVEYRPADQIKAYIRNPLTFRYSTMPAHASLTEADLEGIVAYFTVMKDRKHDEPAPK